MSDSSRTTISTIAPVWFVISAVLLWSTAGVFIKMTSVGAVEVNFGRALLAAVVVAIYLAIKRKLRFDWFSVLSGFFYAGTLSCFVYANKFTTAANAIFLQYTAPVYILVFAPLILGERFRLKDLATVAACLTGMALFFVGPAAEGGVDTLGGKICGLLAGLCLGFYFILLRHPRSLVNDPALSVLAGNILIVLGMAPFLALGSELPELLDLAAIGYLGVFQIGVAYILFTYGVAKGVRSLDASIIGYIEPLLNPVWVFLFLGETPSIWAVAGGAIIISAVLTRTVSIAMRNASTA